MVILPPNMGRISVFFNSTQILAIFAFFLGSTIAKFSEVPVATKIRGQRIMWSLMYIYVCFCIVISLGTATPPNVFVLLFRSVQYVRGPLYFAAQPLPQKCDGAPRLRAVRRPESTVSPKNVARRVRLYVLGTIPRP